MSIYSSRTLKLEVVIHVRESDSLSQVLAQRVEALLQGHLDELACLKDATIEGVSVTLVDID